MQRDEVRALPKFVVINVLVYDVLFINQFLVGIEIRAKDGHTKAFADTAKCRTNTTRTNDAGRLSMKCFTDKTNE